MNSENAVKLENGTDGMEDVLEFYRGHGTEIKEDDLRIIDIEKLQPSPLNTYKVENIDDLKGNILLCGRLLTPLSVIGPDENGMFTILSGERRYTALSELVNEGYEGFKKIPALVIGGMDLDKVDQQLIIESSNLESRDECDWNAHRFNIIKLLKEKEAMGSIERRNIVKIAGKYMKMSSRYRRMYLQVFESASDELKEMAEKGEIPIASASRITQLPQDVQKQAAEDLKKGASIDAVITKYRPSSDTSGKIIQGKFGDGSKSFFEGNTTDSREKSEIPSSAVENFADLNEDLDDYNAPREKSNQRYDFDYDADDDYGDDNTVEYGSEEEVEEEEEYDPATTSWYDAHHEAPPITNDIDTSGRISQMKAEIAKEDKARYQAKLDTVTMWCKRMMRKSDPTEAEWVAIEACKALAERFA